MAQQYSNRSDLQNPTKKIAKTVATGQTYGEAKQQMDAQRAVPMGTPVPPEPKNFVPAGGFGPLDRPTERPFEPVTAGNPLGAGPGPEVLPSPLPETIQVGSKQDLINQVRYAYSQNPNSALLQLLFELEGTPIA
jgi:hypothetical protein